MGVLFFDVNEIHNRGYTKYREKNRNDDFCSHLNLPARTISVVFPCIMKWSTLMPSSFIPVLKKTDSMPLFLCIAPASTLRSILSCRSQSHTVFQASVP